MGWILRQNHATQSDEVMQKLAGDVLADPYYRALEKPPLRYGIYVIHCLLFFGLGLTIGLTQELSARSPLI